MIIVSTSKADEQWCACRRMHDEVRVVADSPRLSALITKTVGKALRLMAEKAEYMTFAGMPCFPPLHRATCTPPQWQ